MRLPDEIAILTRGRISFHPVARHYAGPIAAPVCASTSREHIWRAEKTALRQVRIGVEVLHVVDGCERDAPPLRLVIEVLRFPSAEPFLHQRAERIGIAAAGQAVLKNLFVRPLGIAHELD